MPRAKKIQPRKSARQSRSQATVDAILVAAEELFAKGGIGEVTTSRIAERAGVSVGSLYQYFPSKEAILGELIDTHSEQTIAKLSERLAGFAHRPIPEVLREIVEVLLEADTIDLGLHRVFLDELPTAGRVEQRQGEIRRATAVVRALLAGRKDELRPKDLDLAAFVLAQSLEAVTNAAVFEFPERLRDPALVDEITAMATRYLLK